MKSDRVYAIDAYRGFVMFLMMAEALRISSVSRALPTSDLLKFLAYHQSHVPWRGCSLHDMIQPSFSFLVGVSLPFSIAARLSRGQSQLAMSLHALWRALILVLLGIFLRSVGRTQTNFTFEDTLTQIGLGYWPLFLLGFMGQKSRWSALAFIVFGYWLAFALFPTPGADFDYLAVGVPKDWPHHNTGIAAHWNKNSNLAWTFDTWFLNLFPRKEPFAFNRGGYATLSFIPTLGTMILGAIAGNWLKDETTAATKMRLLLTAAVGLIMVGWTIDAAGLCPIVKRIWTPTWTLFSGGICMAMLAGFYATTDAVGWSAWSFPLRVIGANSIAAYCMAHLIDGFLLSSFRTHLGQNFFRQLAAKTLGSEYEPLLTGAFVLAALWLILFWMFRRRIFLRV